jgi:hypothetical protein
MKTRLFRSRSRRIVPCAWNMRKSWSSISLSLFIDFVICVRNGAEAMGVEPTKPCRGFDGF